MSAQPEPWLRGPLPGIPALLQPAAHAFVMAREDVTTALEGLTTDDVWREPAGLTPLGFHIAHLSGATDRLLTYARGETLSQAQRETLLAERTLTATRPTGEVVLARWHQTVEIALAQLSATSEAILLKPRTVGRAQLPSTVLGLIFHAAEHASRHTGQIVTTAKAVRHER